ncbi:class I SAM-dependent methyltransferase [Leptospira noguchii]|uniref:class I SAM-dependent methyltransferase n=1 Tax=Leptospira noguchii TaxID=28182 RepID=UPI0006AC8E0A|nr:class I SAM-dependent methyltransferase [Leptospira noguchii]
MTNIFDSNTENYQAEIEKYTGIVGKNHDFFVQDKIRLLRDSFSEIGNLETLKVLDIGCGIGLGHSQISEMVNELHGVDISAESLKLAKGRNPNVIYDTYDGNVLPFQNNTFDCVYAICVMHHVPKSQWNKFVQEMLRVVRVGGKILIIEHNPLNPATLYIVKNIELDRDANLLTAWKSKKIFRNAGADRTKVRYTLFMPFDHAFFRKMDTLFSWIPFGAQYIASARKLE